jgi:SAM-dependent methyltransferase
MLVRKYRSHIPERSKSAGKTRSVVHPVRHIGNVLYGPNFAAIYDNAMGDAADPALLDGLRRAIRHHGIRASSIADIGCGTGRLLAELARPGRRLYGIDASPAMLEVTRHRLGESDVTLLRQDLRALALPEQVDLLLCTFATLNYLLTNADLDRAFAGFRRNLKRGGHLIFDFIPHTADAASPASTLQRIATQAGRSIWHVRMDPQRGMTETRIIFERGPGSPAASERHVQRWYPIPTVMAMLARNGLMTLGCERLGGGGPSQWIMVVARRADGRRITW